VGNHPRIVSGAAAALGVLVVAIGVVYLSVACENLPGVLGPSAGDAAPRTPLGAAVVVLGFMVLAAALFIARRRPSNPHL
jgi:amino acid permease